MKQIEISLNTKSLKKAIKELKQYRDSLSAKNELFVNRLLDVGIKVAYQHADNFGKYIGFEKEIEGGGTRCVGIFKGINKEPVISEWDYYGERKTAEVNMLAMAEFGSGWLSEVLFHISGVGPGTFPGQTHALDEHGWWWKEWDPAHKGEWVHSYGLRPSHPMYYADMEMTQQIEKIAKEVFSSDI